MDPSSMIVSNYFAGGNRYERLPRAISLIGFGRTKTYSMIRDGRIKAKKVDGSVFIDMASVAALFADAPEIVPSKHRSQTVTATELGLTELTPPTALGPGMVVSSADLTALSGLTLGDELATEPAMPAQAVPAAE
jgi:hypothetical protein